jgi:hypothetical protein
LVEQLIRNQQVTGSSPVVGSIEFLTSRTDSSSQKLSGTIPLHPLVRRHHEISGDSRCLLRTKKPHRQ